MTLRADTSIQDHLSWGALAAGPMAELCLSTLARKPPGDIKRALYRVLEWLGPYYDIEVGGLKFRCRANDNMSETELVVDPSFHDAEINQIIPLLKPGDTFVDVGANSGIFTCFAARAVGPAGSVLAIEPNPAMVERLRVNAALNGFKNIQVAPIAVGGDTGSAEIYVLGKHQHRSSMHPALVQKKRAIQVPITTFHSILTSHNIQQIDVLKIDIEGYEDRALLPLLNTAPQGLWPNRIFIEIVNRSYWQTDCLARLQQLGYMIVWQSEHDALLVRQ